MRIQKCPRLPLGALLLAAHMAVGLVVGCSLDDRGLAKGDGAAVGQDSTSNAMTTGSGGAGIVGGDPDGGTPNPGSGGELGGGGSVGTAGHPGTGGVGVVGGGGHALGGASGGAAGPGGSTRGGTGGESAGTGGIGAAGATGATGGAGGGNGPCNPSTCADGCCMGNVCTTNRNDQRCGAAGAACAPCPACYQCSNMGVCGLDPGALWDVICSSATIAPTMPSNTNGAWDTGVNGAAALPDPFCQFVRNGNVDAETATLMNTLEPEWNQSIAPPNVRITQNFLVSRAWEIAVIDDDMGVTTNDVACSVAPQLVASDFAAARVELPPTQRCTSLTIKLVCAE